MEMTLKSEWLSRERQSSSSAKSSESITAKYSAKPTDRQKEEALKLGIPIRLYQFVDEFCSHSLPLETQSDVRQVYIDVVKVLTDLEVSDPVILRKASVLLTSAAMAFNNYTKLLNQ